MCAVATANHRNVYLPLLGSTMLSPDSTGNRSRRADCNYPPAPFARGSNTS